VPNRRRRTLSTAMSAFAALAVASPVALFAVAELSESTKPAPQHREFVQAAMITDLPGELMSALSQGLSQFGINLPLLPTGLLSGSGTSSPALTAPSLMAPGLSTPGLTSPSLTTPGVSVPPVTATGPALTDPALTNPALTSPTGEIPGALTTPPPATPGLTTPGLTTPSIGTDPALASPISNIPGLAVPGEVPISAPVGLDPALGTYPILGDPMLAATPAPASGGLLGDLSSAAEQLGAGQAIDLLKGVAMPAIMSAIKSAAPPAPPAPAPGA
jgi:hypothetical protein